MPRAGYQKEETYHLRQPDGNWDAPTEYNHFARFNNERGTSKAVFDMSVLCNLQSKTEI